MTAYGHFYEGERFRPPWRLQSPLDRPSPSCEPFARLRASARVGEGSGLYYYRLRFYDPAAGRFVSRDPLGMWGDPGQRGNAQNYCGNNPVNRVDPPGLEEDVKLSSKRQSAFLKRVEKGLSVKGLGKRERGTLEQLRDDLKGKVRIKKGGGSQGVAFYDTETRKIDINPDSLPLRLLGGLTDKQNYDAVTDLLFWTLVHEAAHDLQHDEHRARSTEGDPWYWWGASLLKLEADARAITLRAIAAMNPGASEEKLKRIAGRVLLGPDMSVYLEWLKVWSKGYGVNLELWLESYWSTLKDRTGQGYPEQPFKPFCDPKTRPRLGSSSAGD